MGFAGQNLEPLGPLPHNRLSSWKLQATTVEPTQEVKTHDAEIEPSPLTYPNRLNFTDVNRSSYANFTQAFKLNYMTPFWKKVKWGSVVRVKVAGGLPLTAPPPMLLSAQEPELSAVEMFRTLILAASDPRVEAVLMNFEIVTAGWGVLQETRRHMDYFRQSGKPLIGYSSLVTPKEVYLGSGCSEFYVAPEAYMSLKGFSIESTFLKSALKKAGVTPQVKKIGAYKSAADQWLREDMSEEQKEVTNALIGAISNHWVDQVAANVGSSKEEIRVLLDSAPYTVAPLVEGKIVTGAMYQDELDEMMKTRFGRNPGPLVQLILSLAKGMKEMTNQSKDKPSLVLEDEADAAEGKEKEDAMPKKAVRYLQAQKYGRKIKSGTFPGALGGSGKTSIAIIPASGAITGDFLSIPGQMGGIKPAPFREMVEQVAKDRSISGVVVWIDSPGGDAIASDYLWRDIQRLRKLKPVVACMANVAASGGYYMAMACEKIVCDPVSITGSIGVFNLKFSFEELFERLGYSVQRTSVGKFAEVDATERSLKPEEDEYLNANIRSTYEKFVGKCADSRNMTFEQLDGLAQGRVWTGQQALENGLVDSLGGLWQAVNTTCDLIEGRLMRNQPEDMIEKLKIQRDKVRISIIQPRKKPSPLGLLLGGAAAYAASAKAANQVMKEQPMMYMEDGFGSLYGQSGASMLSSPIATIDAEYLSGPSFQAFLGLLLKDRNFVQYLPILAMELLDELM